MTHDQWMMRKEHEQKLKEQLVREAKRDMLEALRKKKEEEER